MTLKRNINRLIALARCRAESFVYRSRIPKTTCDVDRRRQIFVDVSELVKNDAGTGIPRVTKRILQELLLLAPTFGFEVRPVCAETSHYGYRYAPRVSDVFVGENNRGLGDFISCKAGDLFLGLDLHHYVVRNQRPFYDSLQKHGVKIFFVVYDLLPIQFPECFEHPSAAIHEKWLKTLCRYDGALCISNSVANELRTWICDRGVKPARNFRITSFRLGSDFTRIRNEKADQLSHRDRTRAANFLVVGTLEPRKCHQQVLDAFDLLWADGFSATLTFVGKRGWKTESLVERIAGHPRLNKDFMWLEAATDDQLDSIYRRSDCLIAASKGEGFGLPIVEAAQRGVSVIARDIPVFREVTGDEAQYFRGPTSEALAAAIGEWLRLYSRQSAPPPHFVYTTSWTDSARELLRALAMTPLPRIN